MMMMIIMILIPRHRACPGNSVSRLAAAITCLVKTREIHNIFIRMKDL